MDLLKDEQLNLRVISSNVRFTRYAGNNERFLELIAEPTTAPIILPSGSYFSSAGAIDGRERAYGEIKVILKVCDLKDLAIAGEVFVSDNNLKVDLALNEKQMDSIFCLLSNNQMPLSITCYVKDSKDDDPNYKALNLRKSSYSISDWDLSFGTKNI
jgi:hypothetical protein